MKHHESPTLPLFAQLLESSETQVATGGTTPTYTCLDVPCPLTYPSVEDESGRGDWLT